MLRRSQLLVYMAHPLPLFFFALALRGARFGGVGGEVGPGSAVLAAAGGVLRGISDGVAGALGVSVQTLDMFVLLFTTCLAVFVIGLVTFPVPPLRRLLFLPLPRGAGEAAAKAGKAS